MTILKRQGSVLAHRRTPPDRSAEPELMDLADHSPAELEANLRDIRRVNRLLGGTSTVLRHLPGLLAEVPEGRPARILDLATGSADIPVAVARWARGRGRAVEIVASDASEAMLAVAARHVGAEPSISLATHDARAVDLPDGSFDVVICSLSLHHFQPGEAVDVLREMDRLARVGFILNDLRRDRLGYWAAWVASRLSTRNQLTRHDAPLSVLRAYTPAELAGLLGRAGVAGADISTHRWFRMAAVVSKPEPCVDDDVAAGAVSVPGATRGFVDHGDAIDGKQASRCRAGWDPAAGGAASRVGGGQRATGALEGLPYGDGGGLAHPPRTRPMTVVLSAASRHRDAEVVVVGGGPAGSSLAAELALAGHEVVLLDKARFPRHKACSEYVNAGGVRLLDGIGVLGEALGAGAHRMEAMVVVAPNGARFAADFAAAEPGAFALGLSRYRLDALLLDRARAAGVDVRENAHARELLREGDRVEGVTATVDGVREDLRAAVVVGADGRNSAVVRGLGGGVSPRWPNKTGLVAHYRGVRGLERNGEMHVGRHGYAGLAPLEDGLTNVAVVSDALAVEGRGGSVGEHFQSAIAALPAVAERLAGAERVGGIRGVGSMAHRARRTVGDGYLLVGDAASFLDPFTGDGIYEALRGAQLAAPVLHTALVTGDTSAEGLAAYARSRRRALTAKRGVTWIVQAFIASPPLMGYAAHRLAARGELAETLSGVLGNLRPAQAALSPVFLARLLRP